MEAVVMLLKTDLAWAAGFIDGEGHIGITRIGQRRRKDHSFGTKENYTLVLTVSQTMPDPLLKLQGLFGGTVRASRADNYQYRRVWKWALGARAAAEALSQIFPYLIVKRKQADLGLSFATTMRGVHNAGLTRELIDYRRELAEQMHLLNRGKPVEQSEPTLKSRQIRLLG